MLGDPEREDRDLDGEVVELDAIEVLDVDLRLGEQHLVLRVEVGETFQDRVLELAQLLVGDDEEVARPTGRVEHLDRADPLQQRLEFLERSRSRRRTALCSPSRNSGSIVLRMFGTEV